MCCKTLPALAVAPPVGASPPSSSSVSGSPGVCVCGRHAQSDILLHISGSADRSISMAVSQFQSRILLEVGQINANFSGISENRPGREK